MKTDRCQRYLEDPEKHAAHLAECAECTALFRELDWRVGATVVQLETLPLAEWEGAAYRPWPLVAGTSLAVVAMATALFMMDGVSPLAGMAGVVRANVPSADLVASLLRLASTAVQNAPAAWQIGIGVSFIVINVLFILLLRRAPKGIDV